MGASSGMETEDETGSTSSGETPEMGGGPAQMCDAFAERCGSQLPALCDEVEAGLEVPESCDPVATAYLECLDQLSCGDAAEDNFACQEEFQAAHEACGSVFGFCRSRLASNDDEQDDPESCESFSSGCIDGSDYALLCEPEDGTVTCSCFVNFEMVGSFEKPEDEPPNFCRGRASDELAVEACGWSPGIVPPVPVG